MKTSLVLDNRVLKYFSYVIFRNKRFHTEYQTLFSRKKKKSLILSSPELAKTLKSANYLQPLVYRELGRVHWYVQSEPSSLHTSVVWLCQLTVIEYLGMHSQTTKFLMLKLSLHC